MTGANLRAEFERQDAERQEQEHAAAEKEKQKEADTAERAQRVANDALNRDFEGRLTSYKKDDLRALAIALSISDKGTNSELLSRIDDCFKKSPNLKNNSRFSNLFSKRRTGKVTLDQPEDLQSQQQVPLTPSIANTFGASHPATPASHVPAAGPSHASGPSASNLPPFPQPAYPYYHQFHPQNSYPYNASHIAPPNQPVTFPNPSVAGHFLRDQIPPAEYPGSHLNPQHK